MRFGCGLSSEVLLSFRLEVRLARSSVRQEDLTISLNLPM